jgi:hypothetical protein
MADTTYDLAWLQDWASKQVYTDSGAASWLVISQVCPNFPNHAINIGPTEDGRYSVQLTGPIINGDTVYINPTS